MLIEELFGKTITNIYATFGVEQEWLDTADCFIEIDNNLIIGFPYGFDNKVWIRELDINAVSIIKNLSDFTHYHINQEQKTIQQINEIYKQKRKNIFNRIRKIFFGQELTIKEYQPYKIEQKENKAKHIINSKIVDFLYHNDQSEKGLFILDNGFIISETMMSPSGTGMAGLNYYETFSDLVESKEQEYFRLTETKKGSS